MADEDYEIMSHKDIIKLRDEVENIKKNPLGNTGQSRDFLDTVSRLEVSMNNMLEIFKSAYSDFKQEDDIIVKKMDPFFDRLNKVIDQNERIAEALVAMADMIKEIKIKMDAMNQNNQPRPPVPMQPMYGSPQGYPGMQQQDFSQMPPLNPPMPGLGQDQFNPLPSMGAMPPPPATQFPDKPKKRGLFGK